jgi:hypothetical protein
VQRCQQARNGIETFIVAGPRSLDRQSLRSDEESRRQCHAPRDEGASNTHVKKVADALSAADRPQPPQVTPGLASQQVSGLAGRPGYIEGPRQVHEMPARGLRKV